LLVEALDDAKVGNIAEVMPSGPSSRTITVMKRMKNENRLSIGTSRCFGNTSRKVSASEADMRYVASSRTGRKKKMTGMKREVAPCRSTVERGMACFGFIATGKLGELGRWRRINWRRKAT